MRVLDTRIGPGRDGSRPHARLLRLRWVKRERGPLRPPRRGGDCSSTRARPAPGSGHGRPGHRAATALARECRQHEIRTLNVEAGAHRRNRPQEDRDPQSRRAALARRKKRRTRPGEGQEAHETRAPRPRAPSRADRPRPRRGSACSSRRCSTSGWEGGIGGEADRRGGSGNSLATRATSFRSR